MVSSPNNSFGTVLLLLCISSLDHHTTGVGYHRNITFSVLKTTELKK
jgi:hypothetical protein